MGPINETQAVTSGGGGGLVFLLYFQVVGGFWNEYQEGFTIRQMGQIPKTRSRTRQRGRYRHLGLDKA